MCNPNAIPNFCHAWHASPPAPASRSVLGIIMGACRALGGAHRHCKVWLYAIIIFKRIDTSWMPCSSPLILAPMAAQPRGCWEGRHSGCVCSHYMPWWEGCPPLWRERSKQAPGTVCSAFHVSGVGGAQQGGSPCPLCAHFQCPAWHLH